MSEVKEPVGFQRGYLSSEEPLLLLEFEVSVFGI
jgi:hypothetical protein